MSFVWVKLKYFTLKIFSFAFLNLERKKCPDL